MKWLQSVMLACVVCIFISACASISFHESTLKAPEQAIAIPPKQVVIDEEPDALIQDEPKFTPASTCVEEALPGSNTKAEDAEEEALKEQGSVPTADTPLQEASIEGNMAENDAGYTESDDCLQYALQPQESALQTSGHEDSSQDAHIKLALKHFGLKPELDNSQIKVTYNSEELFSCFLLSSYSKQPYPRPLTIDKATGAVCTLADFFSHTDSSWKALLRDIVSDEALARGMTLLCEVPPVSGNHPFYIAEGVIVLVYRPYEITTFEGGSPCFALPMNELKAYTSGAYGIGN